MHCYNCSTAPSKSLGMICWWRLFKALWWEKYLSKSSLLKHTCSWLDKLIVLWILNRQAKIFLRIVLASLAKWLSVFYELSGCRFEYCCNHLKFRCHACFQEGVQATQEWGYTLKCILDMIRASSQINMYIFCKNVKQQELLLKIYLWVMLL